MDSRVARMRGMQYLIQVQEPDGSFLAIERSEDGNDVSAQNIFITLLTLTALAPLKNEPQAAWQELFARGTAFAAGQAGERGSFNYWRRDTAMRFRLPYPDDLDDSALGIACLVLYGKPLSGTALASLARMLTSAEVEVGGPYNTWLLDFRSAPAWQDIDPGVNANIAYLLSLMGVTLPNLTAYLERAIREQDFRSAYYHSPLSILYFIALSYEGPLVSDAVATILRLKGESHWGTPMHTALALSALSRFGADIAPHQAAIAYLASSQQKDGGYPFEALYPERMRMDGRFEAGSQALTTALVIEALALVSHDHELPATPVDRYRIVDTFVANAQTTSLAFGDAARAFIQRLAFDSFWRTMLLMPQLWNDAAGSPVSDELIMRIGVAHASGLAAYSTIDDLADGEGDPALMPFAAYCLRQHSQEFARIIPPECFGPVERILSGIERAVSLEAIGRRAHQTGVIDCTALPEAPACAEKSMGLALPAITVALLTGADDGQLDVIETLFLHILSARQWSDDAHDLMEDLKKGTITPVGKLVLDRYRATHPDAVAITITHMERELLQLFWAELFDEICAAIAVSLTGARTMLAALALPEPGAIEQLIEREEHALARAREERDRVRAFLRAFPISAGAA